MKKNTVVNVLTIQDRGNNSVLTTLTCMVFSSLISPKIQYVQLDFLVTSAKQSVHTPGMESYVGPNVTVPIVTATRLLDAKTRVR